MNKQKVQTLKGFRDFLPQDKRVRDFVADKIKGVFDKYNFEPIETPTLEYASLLLGKYGEEADKLVYSFGDKGGREVALRYDQTVPTARFLVNYQNDLPKYFRRYQIQNVFRADKPQKGRFREFVQCDCDIFEAEEGIADAEILVCCWEIFKNLGFEKVRIKINDRRLLSSILSKYENADLSVFSLMASIDKLDKTGENGVIEELVSKGLGEEKAWQGLKELKESKISVELEKICEMAEKMGIENGVLEFDSSLARGLDYYTGMIFEIIIEGYIVGSVGGGGRYDNLIKDLAGLEMKAVGVGLGFDRIVEAIKQFNLYKNNDCDSYLITIFDEKYQARSLQVARRLREQGSRVEIYPKVDKLGKQFRLANQKQIKYVVVLGEEEVDGEFVTIKDMQSGEQKRVKI